MKKLSILLIVSLLILTGCQTVPKSEPIDIPPFSVPAPTRPTLETIPSDAQGAIKALTMNMSKLVKHIEKWETYKIAIDLYSRSIIAIINERD